MANYGEWNPRPANAAAWRDARYRCALHSSRDTSNCHYAYRVGQTAVISATPFLLRANRVLVLTPSRIVREQIAEEFSGLLDLRRFSVFDSRLPGPAVYNITGKMDSLDEWLNLRPYDVIIGTPNSTSPEFPGVVQPPVDFFDLVLVDEAHHSAARSWKRLLEQEQLSSAKQVLFTATPFRRDRRELVGKLAYVYELRDAYRDGVYGRLEYQPITTPDGNFDLAIARAAAARLRADRAEGLEHLLMVRTGTKSRARDLLDFYSRHTDLKLQLVMGEHTLARLRSTLDQLRARRASRWNCLRRHVGGGLRPSKPEGGRAPHAAQVVTRHPPVHRAFCADKRPKPRQSGVLRCGI